LDHALYGARFARACPASPAAQPRPARAWRHGAAPGARAVPRCGPLHRRRHRALCLHPLRRRRRLRPGEIPRATRLARPRRLAAAPRAAAFAVEFGTTGRISMLREAPLAIVDLETTGTHPARDRVTEIAVLEVNGFELAAEWSTLVNPETSIEPGIQALTGISNEMLAAAPRFAALDAEALWQFLQLAAREHGEEIVAVAARQIARQPTLPPHLERAAIDAIPEAPGVYLFYGEGGTPLYVGKSVAMRTRVLAHFSDDI